MGYLVTAGSRVEEGEVVEEITGEEVVVTGEEVVVTGAVVGLLLVEVIGVGTVVETGAVVVELETGAVEVVIGGVVLVIEDQTFFNKTDKDQTIFTNHLEGGGRAMITDKTKADKIRTSSDKATGRALISSLEEPGGSREEDKEEEEEAGEGVEQEMIGHQREEGHHTIVGVMASSYQQLLRLCESGYMFVSRVSL